jgi:hypothetical protein
MEIVFPSEFRKSTRSFWNLYLDRAGAETDRIRRLLHANFRGFWKCIGQDGK